LDKYEFAEREEAASKGPQQILSTLDRLKAQKALDTNKELNNEI